MSPPLEPPLFDANASLATVLAWAGLPHVLRRALTRSVSPETLARVTFVESLRSSEPRFREWLVGLLALDIGVDLHDQRDNLIGVFSQGALATARMTRFCIHAVGPRQGFGASCHAPAPTAPATVCAAAYLYFTASRLVESDFVFIAGPSAASAIQLHLRGLDAQELDAGGLDHALAATTPKLTAVSPSDQLAAVVREAVLECRLASPIRDWQH